MAYAVVHPQRPTEHRGQVLPLSASALRTVSRDVHGVEMHAWLMDLSTGEVQDHYSLRQERGELPAHDPPPLPEETPVLPVVEVPDVSAAQEELQKIREAEQRAKQEAEEAVEEAVRLRQARMFVGFAAAEQEQHARLLKFAGRLRVERTARHASKAPALEAKVAGAQNLGRIAAAGNIDPAQRERLRQRTYEAAWWGVSEWLAGDPRLDGLSVWTCAPKGEAALRALRAELAAYAGCDRKAPLREPVRRPEVRALLDWAREAADQARKALESDAETEPLASAAG